MYRRVSDLVKSTSLLQAEMVGMPSPTDAKSGANGGKHMIKMEPIAIVNH